ncbi:hypothetical protein [Luteibacter sp. E-22]|uniref:hypothetical protein n=1 Tax=Luteibacter sp. E-22 TaxID=3404050 RepID=UPI003CF18BA0
MSGTSSSTESGLVLTLLSGYDGSYDAPLPLGPLTVEPTSPSSPFSMGEWGLALDGKAIVRLSTSHRWVELLGTSLKNMIATFFDDAGNTLDRVTVPGHLPLAYANDKGIRSFELSHDSSMYTPSLWKVIFRELPSSVIPLTGYNGNYPSIDLGDASITANPEPIIMHWYGMEHVNRPRIELAQTYTNVGLTGSDDMSWLRAAFLDGDGNVLKVLEATEYGGPRYHNPKGIRYVELHEPIEGPYAALATSVVATDDTNALDRYLKLIKTQGRLIADHRKKQR